MTNKRLEDVLGEIIVKNKNGGQLVNQNDRFSKSRLLCFSNMNLRLTDRQHKLLAHALKQMDETSYKAVFSATDFAKMLGLARWDKVQIDRDLRALLDLKFFFFDDKFFEEEKKEGLSMGFNLFNLYKYKNSKIELWFNDKAIQEVIMCSPNLFQYSFEDIKNMTFRGMILYELILMFHDPKTMTLEMSVSSLKRAYYVEKQKAFVPFYRLNDKYIKQAVEEISENTGFSVIPHTNKQGKSVETVTFEIVVEKPELLITDKQKNLVIDIVIELEELLDQKIESASGDNLNLREVEKELFEFLLNLQGQGYDLISREGADRLIKTLKWLKNGLLSKYPQLSEKEILEVPFKVVTEEKNRTVELLLSIIAPYGIANNYQEKLTNLVKSFGSGADEIVDVLIKRIEKENPSKPVPYAFSLLSDWHKAGLTSGYQVLEYLEKNYPTEAEVQKLVMDEDFKTMLDWVDSTFNKRTPKQTQDQPTYDIDF